MLEEAAAKSNRSGNGNAGMHAIQAEADRVAQEYESFKETASRDIDHMKRLKRELQQQIAMMRTEINSERPHSAYSNLSQNNAA